jgi:predicted enzyme related to lactoylglutathione lyase
MEKNANNLNWFEIPAADISRAKKFYETVFNIQMDEQEMMGMKMAFFPSEPGNGKASGGVVQSETHTPSMDGSVIYLNANPDLQHALDRVESAGGKVLMPKTKISDDIGHMAFFADSEGNRMALHSSN